MSTAPTTAEKIAAIVATLTSAEQDQLLHALENRKATIPNNADPISMKDIVHIVNKWRVE